MKKLMNSVEKLKKQIEYMEEEEKSKDMDIDTNLKDEESTYD